MNAKNRECTQGSEEQSTSCTRHHIGTNAGKKSEKEKGRDENQGRLLWKY